MPFSRAAVAEVTVTLANASVAYHHCFTDGPYSCGGQSRRATADLPGEPHRRQP